MSENKTKEELAEEIMDILAVDLESLPRMRREDLIQLHKRLSELKTSGELFDKPLSEILDEKIDGKPLRDFTLGELRERVRDEGPLGLGIIPEIKRIFREEIKPEIRRIIRGEREEKRR